MASLVTVKALPVIDSCCCISVHDHGGGMTPLQIARVFDKFYRVDASDTAVGRLGLEMSIARQIVEAHKGGGSRVLGAKGPATQRKFYPTI